MDRESMQLRCTPAIAAVRIITGLVNAYGCGFYYYSTTISDSGPYEATLSALLSRRFSYPQRCRWCWMPTVAAEWACETAPGKPVGKHPAKSIETECEALMGQRRGDEEMLVEDIVSR